ncbi:type IV pilin protein [Acinetobacter sp. 18QD2AZ41W]|uniref:type IV pilin protein n=1 Tax=Acinetobacter sp. 18QD2AZ41W TaxID=2692137 RepID=UPI00135BE6F5|nr:type IV pilin protein [Acinetobacter sp. 18QD2AZ41W]
MKIVLSTQKAFTLIELMVVIVIVAIFAAITIPSYQGYVRKANAAQAQQEVQRIASELEKWKSRNFNYLGFNLSSNSVQGYSFDIRDGSALNPLLTASSASGQNWVIRAEHTANKNYTFLMSSGGLRCKNKTEANVSFTGCGTLVTGREEW